MFCARYSLYIALRISLLFDDARAKEASKGAESSWLELPIIFIVDPSLPMLRSKLEMHLRENRKTRTDVLLSAGGIQIVDNISMARAIMNDYVAHPEKVAAIKRKMQQSSFVVVSAPKPDSSETL